MEMTQEQYHKWFNDNAFWLREWIKEAVPTIDRNRFDGMKIFRTRIPNVIMPFRMPNMGLGALVIERNETLRDAIFVHMHNILRHAVFGARRRIYRGPYRVEYFSGFYSRTGRLPTPSDVVVLEYMPKRWLLSSLAPNYPTSGDSFYISECRLLIL